MSFSGCTNTNNTEKLPLVFVFVFCFVTCWDADKYCKARMSDTCGKPEVRCLNSALCAWYGTAAMSRVTRKYSEAVPDTREGTKPFE